jgi:hypothetical protein
LAKKTQKNMKSWQKNPKKVADFDRFWPRTPKKPKKGECSPKKRTLPADRKLKPNIYPKKHELVKKGGPNQAQRKKAGIGYPKKHEIGQKMLSKNCPSDPPWGVPWGVPPPWPMASGS